MPRPAHAHTDRESPLVLGPDSTAGLSSATPSSLQTRRYPHGPCLKHGHMIRLH